MWLAASRGAMGSGLGIERLGSHRAGERRMGTLGRDKFRLDWVGEQRLEKLDFPGVFEVAVSREHGCQLRCGGGNGGI
jgi:hypothetical protein